MLKFTAVFKAETYLFGDCSDQLFGYINNRLISLLLFLSGANWSKKIAISDTKVTKVISYFRFIRPKLDPQDYNRKHSVCMHSVPKFY